MAGVSKLCGAWQVLVSSGKYNEASIWETYEWKWMYEFFETFILFQSLLAIFETLDKILLAI